MTIFAIDCSGIMIWIVYTGIYNKLGKYNRELVVTIYKIRFVCQNPAKQYGLRSTGNIVEGLNADIVLFDPNKSFLVHAAESESAQGYTPFDGIELAGQVQSTYLRGKLIYKHGEIIGDATGKYLKRSF